MSDQHNYLLASGLVHNGGGKRNGSIAIYIEPWHADIYSFLELKKITVMKKKELEIYSMHFGFLIYL